MATGIYRRFDWVIVQTDDGDRSAFSRQDYEAAGFAPPFGELDTDVEYHVHMLEHGGSQNALQDQEKLRSS